MPLSTKVGLGLGNVVLNVDPAQPPRDTAPQFSAHVCCGQTVAYLSYCWALVWNCHQLCGKVSNTICNNGLAESFQKDNENSRKLEGTQ